MKRKLFSKFFYTCASLVLISMTFLGVVLLAFASRYFEEDKLSLLDKNAAQAVAFTTSNWSSNSYQQVQSSVLQPLFSLLGASIDADVFLAAAEEGGVLLCSQGAGCSHQQAKVPQSVLDELLISGAYRRKGTMDGFLTGKYYVVGCPVYDDTGLMAGVVFACTSASGLTEFLWAIAQMFLISAAVVMIFSFVIIYFITSNLVRPLQEMLLATQSFSKGDFSVRVPVEGDDEVAMLSEAFNTMAGSLATMEQMHRSFTANVSHELKTPMTTIGGFIDGILDGTIPPEKQNHYLRIVSDEIQRLSRLVRSMLAISRIEAGELKISPEPADITETVTRTLFAFEQRIEEKKIQVEGLDSAGRHMVLVDEDLIHQVVYNLIDNAVKFVNEGGALSFAFREEGGKTLVSFRNTGAGLSAEEIPRLFDRFYKSDKSRSLDHNGVGLGLYIVKTIVNLHNGEIYVRSEEGSYTEFTVSLPTAPKTAKDPLSFLRKGRKAGQEKPAEKAESVGSVEKQENGDREEETS